ncbi:MAG: nickel-dependent lactate racemase [Anaerolineaceae bacterium]|nr:nickel-dependent lactate racemase [Anaerolineaceae bacterium]
MNPTHVALAYGQREVSVDVSPANLLGVFYPKTVPQTADEDRLIRQALDRPIGTLPLPQIVHPGQKIAIITSDLTRPTPSERLLPPIIAELEAAGIPDEDIFIVMGLGLHRAMTDSEIEAAVTPEIKQRFRVINHDPLDTVHLGVTSRGTPVDIFRPLVEADVRICLGNIEFHYFAGYSGGAKAILPGCASRPAVTANHSWMTKPDAAAGIIEGNPVRLDLEEGVGMLGVDFILNVVLDGEHTIVGAFAGDMVLAHRAGCQVVEDRGCVEIPSLGDIVVTSPGGSPKDINFYQAHKALESAKYFVRQGGIIILAAECTEGFGNKTMQQWMLEIPTPDETIRRIQQEFVLGGHKAAAIALIEKRAAIYLVSSLPDGTVTQMRFTPFASVQQALEHALEVLGDQSKVLVLPQAGSILPKLKAEVQAS